MTVLLTITAWVAISFVFSWLWGTALSRVGDPATADSQLI